MAQSHVGRAWVSGLRTSQKFKLGCSPRHPKEVNGKQKKQEHDEKKCIHCDQFILRKISKIAATSDQMSDFNAKMHQIRFPMGSAQTREGAYSAPPDSLAVFKVLNYLLGEGEGNGRRGENRCCWIGEC